MRKTIVIFLLVIICFILYFIGLRHYKLEIISTFLSEASGAAFGGFLGGCVVWLIREGYVFMRKRPSHVVTYYVADNVENIYGKLIHHRGERITGETAINMKMGGKLNQDVIKNGLWEYKLTENDRNVNKAAFYGPYRFDITEPGMYEANFYYFGRNFSTSAQENPMLFHLEVLLKENFNYHTKSFDNYGKEIPEKKENVGHQRNVTKGKVFLYYRDFLNDKGEGKFGKVSKIRFYHNGTGEFEFKAYVPDEPKNAFDKTVEILKTSQIYFYKIEIMRIYTIEIPEAI
jgi:hypothetical protein